MELNSKTITIDWSRPDLYDLDLTTYSVYIDVAQQYVLSTDLCSETSRNILTQSQCRVSMTTLMNAPYHKHQFNELCVSITATNAVGVSDMTRYCQYGLIQVKPSTLAFVEKEYDAENNRIHLVWDEASDFGGSPKSDIQYEVRKYTIDSGSDLYDDVDNGIAGGLDEADSNWATRENIFDGLNYFDYSRTVTE